MTAERSASRENAGDMDHSPFELVERTVSQPWADDMPTKVEYRSFSPCVCKAGEMVVSLHPIDDTRHVYVSGLRSGMTLDISVAKELGHALLKVASEAERRREYDERREEYRRQTQGQRSELLRQLNELGW